jgi:hypothetical protein
VTTDDVAPMLMIAFFGLLVLGLAQLARIQVEAIGHLRGISPAEARSIYSRDYTDGDGAQLKWSEMRAYCRSAHCSGRLHFWIAVEVTALLGGVGSIVLDQALR